MPLTDIQLANYTTLPFVRRRNSMALSNWASYIRALAMPGTKPDEDWVRRRVVAERIPQQMDSYVQRTLFFFLADPAIREHPEFLSEFNTTEMESELQQHNQDIVGHFMDQFAAQDVTDQQVAMWYHQHGFEHEITEPPEVFVTPRARPSC